MVLIWSGFLSVIRCRDLQRYSGKSDDINAYAKVSSGFWTLLEV